jgi:hypothetical protein
MTTPFFASHLRYQLRRTGLLPRTRGRSCATARTSCGRLAFCTDSNETNDERMYFHISPR